MPSALDLVVFSHLRWDFVWQRPQHLLTRLAAGRRVFFVEEPLTHDQPEPAWERHSPSANLVVCRPRSPLPSPGFHDDQMPVLRRLLGQLLQEERIREPVAWFYTPMALPLVEVLQARAIIYDCMDELSSFRHAPPQMAQREAALLRRADVVFTGGPASTAPARTVTPTSTASPAASMPPTSARLASRSRSPLTRPPCRTRASGSSASSTNASTSPCSTPSLPPGRTGTSSWSGRW